MYLERADLNAALALTLMEALNDELTSLYPEEGANHFELTPDQVASGRGAFFVAYLAGGAVGCGAVRLLGDGAAEIKRMFVRPDARGRGISRRILEALEGEARAMGAVRVLLETGERQPAALGLYESAGYVRVKAFGEYVGDPFSLCMAKELV